MEREREREMENVFLALTLANHVRKGYLTRETHLFIHLSLCP